MKTFFGSLMFAGAFAFTALASDRVCFADETGTVTTLTPVVVVGHPRRPAVTIELTRQRPEIPLHALTHPLDKGPTPRTP